MEKILELIKGEVSMGTYGLVELELRKLVEGQKLDTNKRITEIAALADELESMNRDEFNIRKHVLIAGLMRQLSAI